MLLKHIVYESTEAVLVVMIQLREISNEPSDLLQVPQLPKQPQYMTCDAH